MSNPEQPIGPVRARLQSEYRRHGNAEATARALGLPVEAVRRVLSGKGLRGDNYQRFVAALGLHSAADTPQSRGRGSAAFHVEPPPSVGADTAGHAVAAPLLAGGNPLAELVRQGQAEQAAWVLEFAARLLEAGAQQLRAGVEQAAILREVERAEAASAGVSSHARRA